MVVVAGAVLRPVPPLVSALPTAAQGPAAVVVVVVVGTLVVLAVLLPAVIALCVLTPVLLHIASPLVVLPVIYGFGLRTFAVRPLGHLMPVVPALLGTAVRSPLPLALTAAAPPIPPGLVAALVISHLSSPGCRRALRPPPLLSL